MHLKKKLVVICILVVIPLFPYISILQNDHQGSSASSLSMDGWLEVIDGITILHIRGSPYELGYQHGFLLKEAVNQNIRGFLYSSGVPLQDLLRIWGVMKQYIPVEYIEEMQGLADGAGISFDELAAANMVVIVGDMGGCFGLAGWGKATTDGSLYHARSFDYSFNIQDPLTGVFAHENAVLIVRQPDKGYASLIPSIAGSLHGGGGFNSQGIAIGQQVCWSRDQTFYGMPGQFRVQQVLDYASTAQEAIDLLTSYRDLGWNFVVSDGKIPIGYVVETTANHTYVGTWDDPTEGTPPFWCIEDVVRRTNFFINSSTAMTQRDRYNPSGFMSFIELVRRTDVFYAIWRSYKSCSQEIEKNYELLDINSTMMMFRNCYSGQTDLLLSVIIRLAEGTSFNRAWNMWVADPLSGDLVVCFATKDRIAWSNPVHFFNFYDLLTTTPP